jgi:hypothetical protein
MRDRLTATTFAPLTRRAAIKADGHLRATAAPSRAREPHKLLEGAHAPSASGPQAPDGQPLDPQARDSIVQPAATLDGVTGKLQNRRANPRATQRVRCGSPGRRARNQHQLRRRRHAGALPEPDRPVWNCPHVQFYGTRCRP